MSTLDAGMISVPVPSTLTLGQLCAVIESRFGADVEILQREHGDGSSEAILNVGGALRASWRGRLVNPPIRDGKTPRGPKEYYDLRFYAPNNQV